MNFLMRTVVVGVAVAADAWLIPGIAVSGSSTAAIVGTLAAVALIIGVVNAFVRPVVAALTGCFIVLTLGLFLLVVNAWMLMLSAWVAGQLGLGFTVDGFSSALLGSILISIVTWLLSGMFRTSR